MRFDLHQLNPAQREAVKTIDGPLLILAGAGTGKTRVIAYRAAWLTRNDIPPEQILAVTFTNKAAREMRDRIADLVTPETARAMTLCTFHAFGARLLHHHCNYLGFSPRFAISSESYQIGLVRNLMGELGYSGEGWNPDVFRNRISLAKNALQIPADLQEQAASPVDRAVAEVYALYQTRMRNMDLMDFDDLLVKVLELWERFPEILKTNQEQYRYLMVDEYQDTNPVQFRLVSLLAGEKANLGVVGDDDQSIYGWRGATIENILNFEAHYPGTKVIRLEQNYRSTGIILEAANQVIANNPKRHPKKLWSSLERGEKILTVRADDEEDEARLAAHIIEDYRITRQSGYADFAILYRSNHQSRLFEEVLRQYKIPYCLVGGHSFFERKEVLDAVSLLQVVWNPRNDLSLLRILNVPPRGLGDKAIEKLRELQRIASLPLQQILRDDDFLGNLSGTAADSVRSFTGVLEKYRPIFAETGNLSGKIKSYLSDIGYLDGLGRMYKPKEDAQNRQENVLEFINAAAGFTAREGPTAGLGAFLEKFALLDENDREEKTARDAPAVTLMTVHAAKGLEFPVVLMVGMEQGLFPHQQAVDECRLEEERRLFYVALTRARQTLILTHAERRRVRGDSVRRRPSPFLDELPLDLVDIRSSAEALKPATAAVADDYIAKMKIMFAKETKPKGQPE